MEDLQFQCRRELIIYHSDQRTTNLNDFELDSFRLTEVDEVLEANGGVDSDLNGAVSDRILDDCRQILDALSFFEHLYSRNLLFVEGRHLGILLFNVVEAH